MKIMIARVYANTKEDLKQVTDVLEDVGFEIAYESESMTGAAVIKDEVTNEQED